MEVNLRQRALEVLDQGYLMSLGVADGGGVWVADVIYISDDNLTIYWMSSPKTRHSKAIELGGKAAGSITISSRSNEENLGLQFEGEAQAIDDLDFTLAKKHLIKRGEPVPVEPLNILREGSKWYMLKPKIMYLIDEKNFGFKRQLLEF